MSLIIATGRRAGAPLVLAQAGQLGLKAPVLGADGPWSLTARSAAATAFGRCSDFKCMASASKPYKSLAKRYLRAFPQNEFMEDDAVAGYAYVKIVAQAIQNVGTKPAGDRGLRPQDDVQHPRGTRGGSGGRRGAR